MTGTAVVRATLGVVASALLVAACDGSQPPIGAPGAMPQASAIAANADRGKSWMLPEAKSENLIYVSTVWPGVFVFTYPKGKLVGMLGGGAGEGLCSDNNGDVFVVTNATEVIEYAHGKTDPIKVLDDSGNYPLSCAVDPTTGDLALAGGNGTPDMLENIAVYANASGSPTVYSNGPGSLTWCTYDNKGNIFATTGGVSYGTLFELSKGSGTLTDIPVDETFGDSAPVQWDGEYLAITDTPPGGTRHTNGPTLIYRVQVSGSAGTVVDTLQLLNAAKENEVYNDRVQFWIYNGKLITAKSGDDAVGTWRYPSGGSPVQKIKTGLKDVYGLTLSLAKH